MSDFIPALIQILFINFLPLLVCCTEKKIPHSQDVIRCSVKLASKQQQPRDARLNIGSVQLNVYNRSQYSVYHFISNCVYVQGSLQPDITWLKNDEPVTPWVNIINVCTHPHLSSPRQSIQTQVFIPSWHRTLVDSPALTQKLEWQVSQLSEYKVKHYCIACEWVRHLKCVKNVPKIKKKKDL